jgi:cytochrome c-type biogenesis protein CcmE
MTGDLAPRPVAEASGSPRKRRWLPTVVVAGVLVAGGFIVTQFLTQAIDYYCNVDELGVREGCDGDRRLRVQGMVEQDSLRSEGIDTTFLISFGGRSIEVRYAGDPGGIFQECIPVVAHGRVIDGVLESDRIEVKHSNVYEAENADRLDASAQEAEQCSPDEG